MHRSVPCLTFKLLLRAPIAKPSAPNKIDFPDPVSPVTTVSPSLKSKVSSLINAKFFICSRVNKGDYINASSYLEMFPGSICFRTGRSLTLSASDAGAKSLIISSFFARKNTCKLYEPGRILFVDLISISASAIFNLAVSMSSCNKSKPFRW